MNRKILALRLLHMRGGYQRAAYLKKKGLFHSVGKHCYLLPYNWGTESYLISFGDNVHISTGVRFVNHDITAMMFRYQDKHIPYTNRIGPIVIGNNVFVGAESIILYDVHIGDNVIIGAGSVVNKDVPSGSVVAGVPARVIGSYDDYKKRMQEATARYPWKDTDSEKRKKEKRIAYFWK